MADLRTASLASLISTLVLTAACGGDVLYLAGEGCLADTECKGDRICHQGECLYPEQIGEDGGVIVTDGGSDGGPDGGPDAGPIDSGVTGGLVGDACTQDGDCDEGAPPRCFSEADTFGTFTGGYCSVECSANIACPAGTTCGMLFGGSGACLRECGSDADCRDSYTCSDLLGPAACIPSSIAP